MIPRTFPSTFAANVQQQMVVYSLPSITGLTAWIDYIPVKGVTTESATLENTYANGGYQVVDSLASLTGKQAWLDYIPVYEDASYTKPWSTDAGGYIPVGGLFSIPSLFASGAPGAWYDPSDLTTLFQDSAGTTPVTAVEQPVGLMLDKSQGLVLGSERVGATWLGTDATWSQSGSTLIAVLGSNFSIYQTIVPANSFYRVTFEIFDYVAGTLNIHLGNSGAVLANFNANGTYTVTASASGDGSFYWMGNSTFTGKIRNISVKQLAGNHAFQATSASRPVLSARYNLLTKTEDFSDASWQVASSGGGVTGIKTPNYGVAPDGTTTACRVQLDVSAGSAGAQSQMYKTYTTPTVGTLAPSAWLRTTDGSTKTIMGFTAAGGTPLTITVTGTWTRIPGSRPSVGASDNYQIILIKGTTSDTADLLIWHPDSRVSNDGITQPAYQRVNTATDYATIGFLPYLKFDGVDDSLSTNSISFTSTDKMSVFAGVRKLSDVQFQHVVELSPHSSINAGAFVIAAPDVTATYLFRSKGSLTPSSALSAASYPAPITNTLTGFGDISGDLATLRLNGAQVAQSTADQGSGNYGNYPLFIGRRNNASLPFNGQMYSMIIVGKAVTAGELSSTETYVATKTGVTL